VWAAHAWDSARFLILPPPQIICNGKELEDGGTLEAGGVTKESTLFVVSTPYPFPTPDLPL
jgi:hypothetical protein